MKRIKNYFGFCSALMALLCVAQIEGLCRITLLNYRPRAAYIPAAQVTQSLGYVPIVLAAIAGTAFVGAARWAWQQWTNVSLTKASDIVLTNKDVEYVDVRAGKALQEEREEEEYQKKQTQEHDNQMRNMLCVMERMQKDLETHKARAQQNVVDFVCYRNLQKEYDNIQRRYDILDRQFNEYKQRMECIALPLIQDLQKGQALNAQLEQAASKYLAMKAQPAHK